MKPWSTMGDLLADIQTSYAKLTAGEIQPDQAHAEARMLGTAAKVLGVRLEHARLTGRLEQSSAELPDVVIARRRP